jgi:hypothetical protein
VKNENECEPEHRDVEVDFPQVGVVGHLLVPQGPMLVCTSCPYEHSYFLPPNYKYLGNDDNGLPRVEKL